MSRVSVDWCSTSRVNYKRFCKKHSNISLTYDEWKTIIYSYNEGFRNHILETGERIKLPGGMGEFSINKRKRNIVKEVNGKMVTNLPIDWKKTKEKGKRIYNFNFHTEGFSFRWMWFRRTAMFKQAKLYYFKPSRVTARMITHYLTVDNEYQHIYREWSVY